MIVEDSQAIATDPDVVIRFLEEIDRHYLEWHPDHISFDWLDGARREHFYFDERIGRWRVRMAMRIMRSADHASATVIPIPRFVRFFMPFMSFAVAREGEGCRYAHRIKLRLGPLRPLLERTFLTPLRRHMREEAENLARIAQSLPVA
jgi:hypothetical protein